MAERWENMPRATSGVPDVTAVSGYILRTRAPLRGRLIPPATRAQGRMQLDVNGTERDAQT